MLVAAEELRSDFADLDVPWWAWVALVVVIVVMLGIDLIRHRDDHEPTMRSALGESAIWVLCGVSFGVVMLIAFGGDAFGEYISGYLIEKSLSVDNVFVWSMIFATMTIPLKYQHRVLFWGIFGALTLRAVFIFAGSALISKFWWLLLVFGVFLIYTGVRVIQHRDDEGEESAQRGVGVLKRFMPVTDRIEGHAFFTRIDGKRAATPLFAALVVVEVTDVIFAVDSVPAILAVSREPFLVFASNAFAILGLRAMYFLLANAKEKFHFLSHALGGILVFVGIKMALSHWIHLNTYLSLAIILGMLAAAIVFSLRRNRMALDASGAPGASGASGAAGISERST
ncbi:MAG: TerC family protein [Ilumatobacteraceae bacterium]